MGEEKTDRRGKTGSGSNGPNPRAMILGIGGSPRTGGNSDILLGRILGGAARTGLETETVHLRNVEFRPCIGCEKCRPDGVCRGICDGMQTLYGKIAAAQGLVMVSPTHNYNVTAWIKAFIDRLYCYYVFDDNRPRGWSSRLAGQGRRAVIAAVCEQEDPEHMGFTLEAMHRPLDALGFQVMDRLAVFGIFDRGRVAKQENTLARAEALGRRLAEALEKSGPTGQ